MLRDVVLAGCAELRPVVAWGVQVGGRWRVARAARRDQAAAAFAARRLVFGSGKGSKVELLLGRPGLDLGAKAIIGRHTHPPAQRLAGDRADVAQACASADCRQPWRPTGLVMRTRDTRTSVLSACTAAGCALTSLLVFLVATAALLAGTATEQLDENSVYDPR